MENDGKIFQQVTTQEVHPVDMSLLEQSKGDNIYCHEMQPELSPAEVKVSDGTQPLPVSAAAAESVHDDDDDDNSLSDKYQLNSDESIEIYGGCNKIISETFDELVENVCTFRAEAFDENVENTSFDKKEDSSQGNTQASGEKTEDSSQGNAQTSGDKTDENSQSKIETSDEKTKIKNQMFQPSSASVENCFKYDLQNEKTETDFLQRHESSCHILSISNQEIFGFQSDDWQNLESTCQDVRDHHEPEPGLAQSWSGSLGTESELLNSSTGRGRILKSEENLNSEPSAESLAVINSVKRTNSEERETSSHLNTSLKEHVPSPGSSPSRLYPDLFALGIGFPSYTMPQATSTSSSPKIYDETKDLNYSPDNSVQFSSPTFVDYQANFSSSDPLIPGHMTAAINSGPNWGKYDASKVTYRGHAPKPSTKEEREHEKSFNISDDGKRSSLSEIPFIYELLANKFLIFAIGGIIVLFLLLYMFFNITSNVRQQPLSNFTSHIKYMEQSFPSQSKNMWRTVRASTTTKFQERQSQSPSVLLMASSTSHAPLALCIAKRITYGFESSFDSFSDVHTIDVNDLKHLDSAKQKLHLDNKFKSVFIEHKRKSFIIDNVQLLTLEAAHLFYNYCDSINAAFKDVVILLIIHFDEKEDKIETERAAENYLEKSWRKGSTEDKVKPLLSRVANHIVLVSAENQTTFARECSSG